MVGGWFVGLLVVIFDFIFEQGQDENTTMDLTFVDDIGMKSTIFFLLLFRLPLRHV